LQTSLGDRHGHNIVAVDYGYQPDQAHTFAPGGTTGGPFSSDRLGCTSCHDPHGRYRRTSDGTFTTSGLPILDSGSYAASPSPVAGTWAVGAYRLLAGVGYLPRNGATSTAFTYAPPDAVSPNVYNRSEAVTQTRVAYGRGFSEWCANCHPGMLDTSSGTAVAARTRDMGGLNHPVGNGALLPPAYQTNYIAYVKTGNLSNIAANRSYWSLVPFEEGTGDYTMLRQNAVTDDSRLEGPTAASSVSCLSCHRAHASGFDGMLRYRAGNSFITVASASGAPVWPDPITAPAEAQGRTQAETQQSYYGRPATNYAAYQATLCNKCHVKD
jgi:predicted CXXCH cytochrome family protein